jgi:hypothetical protein
MAEPAETADKTCAVCRRSLLIGERSSAYVTEDGAATTVCELCKPRAEAAGWLRPEDAERAGGARTAGRRRRGRGELFGGILERTQQRRDRGGRKAEGERRSRPGDSEAGSEPAAGSDSGPDRSRRRSAEAPQPQPSASPSGGAGRSVAGLDLRQALAAFNASESRRTIAGVSRSLGEPHATMLAVRTAGGDTGARLTVAWDLAWYQWEIGPGERGPEVREVGKGETIDQLRTVDQNWNLQMAEDGTLSPGQGSTG